MCNYSVRCAVILLLFIACTSAPLYPQGYPLILSITTDPSGTPYNKGGTGDCADGKFRVNWQNSVAFLVPVQSLDLGNVVKGDSLCGLGFTNWDAAVIAPLPSTVNQMSNFVEYFDVSNHTELSNPSVSKFRQ